MLLILAFLFFLISLYLYTTKNYNYWSRRNVKHDPPLPFFGNHLPNILVRRSVAEIGVELYNKYTSEKIVGYYRGSTKELVVRDPEIARRILTADFMHFHSRGGLDKPKKVPLMHNMILIDGDQWNLLRQGTLPAFSVNSIREMFPLVLKCTEQILETTDRLLEGGGDIDVLDLMEVYAIEVACSCGLGVELDSMKSNLPQLREAAASVFDRTKWRAFIISLEELVTELKWVQWPRMTELKFAKIIFKIIKRERKQRQDKSSNRNDFLNSLMKIEAMGPIRLESLFDKNPDGSSKVVDLDMDLECTVAQILLYFVVQYQSFTGVLGFTLHQLAYHPVVQHKIQQEIDEVLSKYNNKSCYDAIGEMVYLNMALKESLRMFSPLGYIRRKCIKKYAIPGTDVTIDPGVRVFIPNQAFHMDPKYFDSPNEFRPERFSHAAREGDHYAYLPFSVGPRMCQAQRLAETQLLAGLVALLQHYTIQQAPTSQQQHHVKKSSYLMQVLEGPMPIRLLERNNVIS